MGELEPWSGSLPDAAEAAPRNRVVVEVGGKRVEVSLPARLVPATAGGMALAAPPRKRGVATVDAGSGDVVKAPMQSTIVKVAVENGQRVVKGETVVVLEAMKMEQPISAPKDGTITGLDATVGTTVSSGHVLLRIED